MKIPSICLFVGLLHFTTASLYENEQRLRNDLFSNYSKELRPIANLTSYIDIYAKLTIFQVFDLEISTGTLIARSLLEIKWKDEYLKWRPEDYGNIENIGLDSSQLWIPNVVISNSENKEKENVKELVLSYTGDICYLKVAFLRTFCDINIYRYPFDEQICRIRLRIYSGVPRYVRFKRFVYEAKKWYTSQWNIQMNDSNVYENETRTRSSATVYLSRKLSSHTITMILPTLVLSLLSMSVFALPPESGEKVSLATTVFLTNVLYLVQINNMLTSNSNESPLLITYLITLTSMSGLSAIGTIVICKLQISNDLRSDEQPATRDIYAISLKNKVEPMNVQNSKLGSISNIEHSLEHNPKNKIKIYRRYHLLDTILFGIIFFSFSVTLTIFVCIFIFK